MDPATAMLISSGISAGGNILGGMLGNPGDQETRMQRNQRKLIDQLLGSLNGGGKYGDLYSADIESFNKGVRDPMMSTFRNRTAPQIQQEFIASGQQRGTGLEDSLTRAGVDMDSLINQHLMNYQENAQNRKQNTISSILGAGSGAANPISMGQAAAQGAGGFLTSDNFTNMVSQGLSQPRTNNPQQPQVQRMGYTPEAPRPRDYQFQYS